MPIANSLAAFQASLVQCDSLIVNAHQVDQSGVHLFPQRDREQITVAAFLNLFIAWEEFIEASITDFMMGDATISGLNPTRYVYPRDRQHSNNMIVHNQRYFDYSNKEYVRKIAKLYFDLGYPFEIPISSIDSELADLKIIRNACAHLTSTTKTTLEGLANRIHGQPHPGISVYQLLTSTDPRVGPVQKTVYAAYKDKLIAAAHLIANG